MASVAAHVLGFAGVEILSHHAEPGVVPEDRVVLPVQHLHMDLDHHLALQDLYALLLLSAAVQGRRELIVQDRPAQHRVGRLLSRRVQSQRSRKLPQEGIVDLLGQLEAAGFVLEGKDRDRADVAGEARARDEGVVAATDAERRGHQDRARGEPGPVSDSSGPKLDRGATAAYPATASRGSRCTAETGPHARRTPVAARVHDSHEGYDRSPPLGRPTPRPTR